MINCSCMYIDNLVQLVLIPSKNVLKFEPYLTQAYACIFYGIGVIGWQQSTFCAFGESQVQCWHLQIGMEIPPLETVEMLLPQIITNGLVCLPMAPVYFLNQLPEQQTASFLQLQGNPVPFLPGTLCSLLSNLSMHRDRMGISLWAFFVSGDHSASSTMQSQYIFFTFHWDVVTNHRLVGRNHHSMALS